MPDNLTDSEERRLLDFGLVDGDLLALTTTLPSDSAAGTQVVGGSYARQVIDWNAAATSSGVTTKTTNAALLFTSMPAAEVMAWEVYDTTGTTRRWWGLFSPVLDATAQNTGDTITKATHGLINGTMVVFQTGYTPAGLTAGVRYYVVGATTNTFQVATTAGGSAVAITADSTVGQVVYGLVHAVAAGGGLSVAAGALVCGLS